MPELNHLLIPHQDGDQVMALRSGGYAIYEDRLAISIETENVDPQGFPNVAHICSFHHNVADGLKSGDRFTCEGGMAAASADDPEAVKAFGFFVFHAERLDLTWTVVDVAEDRITVELSAIHDDINGDSSRVSERPTTGTFTLSAKDPDELWIPV